MNQFNPISGRVWAFPCLNYRGGREPHRLFALTGTRQEVGGLKDLAFFGGDLLLRHSIVERALRSMSSVISALQEMRRSERLASIVSKVIRRLTPTKVAFSYQEKTRDAIADRWGMIVSVLDARSKSMLDLGSNLGHLTAAGARYGLWSVGIEASGRIVRAAQEQHCAVKNCAFMWSQFGPDDCDRMPQFDVVLILSVHHHWHRQFGDNMAGEMLRNVVENTNHVALFEGPSRVERYGDEHPTFVDNDQQSVTDYYRRYLGDTVGHLVSEVRLLGNASCVGSREPYRWMWALIK